MLSYSEEATSSAMKTYIKELVADAYGWPTVSLMNEPKPMDGEDHSVLLKSGKYSDLTVRCAGKEWRLHRAIVCPKSKFFEKATQGGFEEAATGVINLHEDDPAIFAHLVQYFYTLRYSERDPVGRDSILAQFPSLTAQPLTSRELLEAHCETEVFAAELRAFNKSPSYLDYNFNPISRTMVMNIEVYLMADKYDIPGLKKLAHEWFAKQVHTCQGLVWEHMKDFTRPSIVLSVVQSTQSNNKEIRETLVKMCAWNIDRITGVKPEYDPADTSMSEDWADVFKEDACFTWDVLKLVTEQKAEDKETTEKRWLQYAQRNMTFKDRTKELEAAAEEAKSELTKYKERTGRLLKAIGQQQCQACGSMFQLELLTSAQDPHDYSIRCCACEYKFNGVSTT